MIHGHGNNIQRLKKPVIADFSSNVAGAFINGGLHAHLIDKLPLLSNYPEPDSQSLREKIAAHHALDPEEVLVTNGSVEAFYLIASAFREAVSLILVPSFSEYEDACKLHRHTLRFEYHQRLQSSSNLERFDLVWLARPNNPDGHISEYETLKLLIRKNPTTLFVVDEAYLELSPCTQSLDQLLSGCHNLLVVRSMTKQFVLPGLRLGYLLGHSSLLDKIRRFTQPWSVNSLAQQAGLYLMNHYQRLLPDTVRLCALSKEMQETLSQSRKYAVTPSGCPFFLVQHQRLSAAEVYEYLLSQHGFLIRNASNFRGLSEKHFRISVRNNLHNKALTHALLKLD